MAGKLEGKVALITGAGRGQGLAEARLFCAGEYVDKNAQITVADLDAIVAHFEAGGGVVPLRIEHTETVLDPLGTVTGVYRRGAELFGAVNLPCVGMWAAAGVQLRRLLHRPRALRTFNIAAALLLVGSLYPLLTTNGS